MESTILRQTHQKPFRFPFNQKSASLRAYLRPGSIRSAPASGPGEGSDGGRRARQGARQALGAETSLSRGAREMDTLRLV